jgi:PAS domain-containing protein
MNISLRPGSLFIAVTASNITERVMTRRKLIENEAMYRSLFENAPIPINEADYSQVKRYIDALKKSGIQDLRTYFDHHPNEIITCFKLVKVRTINKKSQEDYQVVDGDYSRIMEYLVSHLTKETMDEFKELLLSLYEGSNFFYFPSSIITSKGKIRHFLNYVLDASPQNDLSRIYISYLDVTEQKNLQLQLLQNNKDLIGVTEEVIAHDAKIKVQTDELRNQYTDAKNLNILYTHLINAAQIPVIIFDSSMIIIWTSTELNQMCGYSDSRLNRENIRILFSNNHEFEQFCHFIKQNESKGRSFEGSLVHKSGIIFKTMWHYIENFTLSDGKKTYAVIIKTSM